MPTLCAAIPATPALRIVKRSFLPPTLEVYHVPTTAFFRRHVGAFMRFAAAFFVLASLLLAGCGSGNSVVAGTIDFGTSQSHHIIKHPTNSFGPDDTFAYLAHIQPRAPIPPHTKIHEYFSRVDSKGRFSPVIHDTFALNIPVKGFIALNSIKVSELYQAGFTAPGRYEVKLMHGREQLAGGFFTLN
jgi:hypothetical protein